MRFSLSILCVCLCFLELLGQGDVSVDPHTGRPIINIPLGIANDRTLSYAIGIAYDASGVKVDSRSGSVGQNWSLIGVGEIRREVRGLPDDYYSTTDSRRGWLFDDIANEVAGHPYALDGYEAGCTAESATWSFIEGFNHAIDSEPDLFHFDAGEISGVFVFDNSGDINNIKLIPYQDIQIKAFRSSSTSPITKFEITTFKGTKYIFDKYESSTRKSERVNFTSTDPFYFRRDYHLYKDGITFNSAWKLSRITSAVGEQIDFGFTTQNTGSTFLVKAGITKASNDDVVIQNQYSDDRR